MLYYLVDNNFISVCNSERIFKIG